MFHKVIYELRYCKEISPGKRAKTSHGLKQSVLYLNPTRGTNLK